MLPVVQPELIEAIQSEIRRNAAGSKLVRLATGEYRPLHSRMLARFGGWLIERGSAIEAQYSMEATVTKTG
jgi:hypothetical protein